jgi:tetratricopeptide (TPR) repeat protein
MKKKILYPLITVFIVIFSIEFIGLAMAFFVDGGGIEKVKLDNSGRMRIVCIGESTTEGGYPQLLQKKLDKIFPGKYKVYNLGESGVTTLYFKQRIESIIDYYKPHYIISMIGINDTYDISHLKTKADKSFFENLFLYKLSIYLKGLRSSDAKVSGALHYLKNGDDEKAYEILYDVFTDDPVVLDNKTLLAMAEYLNEEAREFEKSLKVYDFLIKNNIDREQSMADRLWIYVELGRTDLIEEQEKFLSTLGESWYPRLATFNLLALKKPKKALEYFDKVHNIRLRDEEVAQYTKLLVENNRVEDAQRIVNERIMAEKDSPKTLLSIKRNGLSLDKSISAQKVIEAENSFLRNNTIKNYRYIVEVATKRGIGFYTMQYPMRSTKLLKEHFAPYLKNKSVRMIDNEQSFKKLVKDRGHNAVFTDSFAVDFGHMTDLGKSQLVENIVDAMDL